MLTICFHLSSALDDVVLTCDGMHVQSLQHFTRFNFWHSEVLQQRHTCISLQRVQAGGPLVQSYPYPNNSSVHHVVSSSQLPCLALLRLHNNIFPSLVALSSGTQIS